MEFFYEKIAERQAVRVPKKGEYRDENSGLIMCAKCREALQFQYKGRILPIACRCGREADERIKAQLDEYDRQQRQKRLSMGIRSKVFESYTFDRDDRRNIEVTKLCCEYVRHFAEMEKLSAGLLFYGDVGGGKTFFAGCIANALIKRGIPVLFTSLRELTDNRHAARFKGASLTNLREYRVFVLDDIGAEHLNRQDLENAFSVIDDIYLLQRPLIVTTNLTLSQIERPDNQETARLYSRIRERCPKAVFLDNAAGSRLTEAKRKRREMEHLLS